MARKKKSVTPEEIEKNMVDTIDEIETAPIPEVEENAEPATTDMDASELEKVDDDTDTVIDDDDELEDQNFESNEADNEEPDIVTEVDEGDDTTEDSGATDETTDVSDDDPTEVIEKAPDLPEFMNIEHFADYRKKDEIEPTPEVIVDEEAAKYDAGEEIEPVDNNENAKETQTPENAYDEQPTANDEYREYENLTILDELEEEADEESVPEEDEWASNDEEAYDEKKPRKVDARFDLIEMFVYMLVAIMLLSAFVFRHSVVDGGSMEDTLYDDEHLIITNLFYEPKQYDIVVCEDYTTGLKKPIIKRIIATEGQTVRVVSMDEVYVDGELIDTSFILIDGKEELALQNRYPIECVVPEGEVFVMGDHRNSSLDSRVLGTIDEDAILGKVVLRFYPFDRFGKVE